MIDFTSALYLGIHHAHQALPPWVRLTTGRPAALEPASEAERLSQDIAQLLHCERAILAPSTLHLFWDLFDVLASDRIAIYADSGGYPIARWGIERAGTKGIRVATFPKHDPVSLDVLLHSDRGGRHRPVVVTDGVCTETGRAAPLPYYLTLVRKRSGYLVIDDTQALGILGRDSRDNAPYGRGGGGTPAWYGIDGPELIIGSSLAKGFGAPLAVVASNATVISNFEVGARQGCTVARHPSPTSGQVNGPSPLTTNKATFCAAALRNLCATSKSDCIGRPRSARRAVSNSNTKGDCRRRSESLYRRLLDFGVRAVLHRPKNSPDPTVSFLITASHTRSDICRCMDALRQACVLASIERRLERPVSGGILNIPV